MSDSTTATANGQEVPISQAGSSSSFDPCITANRKKLRANGYVPLPNAAKECYFYNWPHIEVTDAVIDSWAVERPRDNSTGIRVGKGLVVIDIDLDDPLVEVVLERLFQRVPVLRKCLRRNSKGMIDPGKAPISPYKLAFFARTKLSKDRKSKAFVRPGEDPKKADAHKVEIFVGEHPRQFGAFGLHSAEKRSLYQWVARTPLDKPLAEEPEITEADVDQILAIVEEVLREAGWVEVVPISDSSSRGGERCVYDLVETMEFEVKRDTSDGPVTITYTLAELDDFVGDKDEFRCSASFIDPSSTNLRTPRCIIRRNPTRGCVQIWDSASDLLHFPASADPALLYTDEDLEAVRLNGKSPHHDNDDFGPDFEVWVGPDDGLEPEMGDPGPGPDDGWQEEEPSLAELQPAEESFPTTISITPARLRASTAIPPRQHIYGYLLTRGAVTVTAAPTKLGKSTMTMTEALAMASGRILLGDVPRGKLKVWMWNGEDLLDEMDRKLAAAMDHHRVTSDEIAGQLFLDSGLDKSGELVIGGKIGRHTTINEAQMKVLEAKIKALGIDVLIIDPFISTHRLSENDNVDVDRVVKRLAKLAVACNVAIHLIHHVRKPSTNDRNHEVSIGDARGASSLISAARAARVMVRMTRKEADDYGFPKDSLSYRGYFRAGDVDLNLARASDKTPWFRLISQTLDNAQGGYPADEIGVVELWEPSVDAKPPDALAPDLLARLLVEVDTNDHSSGENAVVWLGHWLASQMSLDSRHDTDDRNKLKAIITQLIHRGFLRTVEGELKDKKNRTRKSAIYRSGPAAEKIKAENNSGPDRKSENPKGSIYD